MAGTREQAEQARAEFRRRHRLDEDPAARQEYYQELSRLGRAARQERAEKRANLAAELTAIRNRLGELVDALGGVG